MTAECDWIPFDTTGHDICIYGYLDVNEVGKAVDFFFTDQVGYDTIESGLEATQTILWNRMVGMDWNIILPYEFRGREVSPWYAFVSIAGITDLFMQYRTGTIFIGQDLTPPTVNIGISSEVAGTASFTVTFTESNCNLSEYHVWAGNKLVADDFFQAGQRSVTKSFSFDTTDYPEGNCTITVWVSDTGGAERSYYRYTVVNNIPDTSTFPTSTSWATDFYIQLQALFVFLGLGAADNIRSWVWWLGLVLAVFDASFRFEKARRRSERVPWMWIAMLFLWVGAFLFIKDIGALASVVLPTISVSLSGAEVGGTWWSERGAKQRERDRLEEESRKRREDDIRDERLAQLEREGIEKDARIADLKLQVEDITRRMESPEQSSENPDTEPSKPVD